MGKLIFFVEKFMYIGLLAPTITLLETKETILFVFDLVNFTLVPHLKKTAKLNKF